MKYPFTRNYLKQMNISELQAACNNRKYSIHGTRSQLQTRLLDGDIDNQYVTRGVNETNQLDNQYATRGVNETNQLDNQYATRGVNETNHRDDFQNLSDIIICKNTFLPKIPPILYIVMLWVSLYNINNYIHGGLNSS